MNTAKRPPMADCYSIPHDSIVAKSGIPNGYKHGQEHWITVSTLGFHIRSHNDAKRRSAIVGNDGATRRAERLLGTMAPK